MKTAQHEDKIRAQQVIGESKRGGRGGYDEDDDVDFGANFEKFATYKQPQANLGGDNINDFDFNAAMEKKEESKGGDADFDFNFNDSKPNMKK